MGIEAQRKPPKGVVKPEPPSAPVEVPLHTDGFPDFESAVEAAVVKRFAERLNLGKPGAIPPMPALPTKTELAARIRAIITATLNAHSVAVHRDAVHYLVEALADELYVAPPVDPEDVKGVG